MHGGGKSLANRFIRVMVRPRHAAVIGSCFVGLPDPKEGERIKAFVVLKQDVKGITGYDLIRWCREKLISYKIPQYIEFRDMLPKSKVGKLLRREIRSEEKEGRRREVFLKTDSSPATSFYQKIVFRKNCQFQQLRSN
jgi:acyl-CoA synthetase (AMP-forming)/AMP-acid ligase II